jgi:hypothetical protein
MLYLISYGASRCAMLSNLSKQKDGLEGASTPLAMIREWEEV